MLAADVDLSPFADLLTLNARGAGLEGMSRKGVEHFFLSPFLREDCVQPGAVARDA
jgi:hypothetical protein